MFLHLRLLSQPPSFVRHSFLSDRHMRKWDNICYSNVDRHLLVALAVVTFAVVVADFVVVTVVVVLREVVVNFAV